MKNAERKKWTGGAEAVTLYNPDYEKAILGSLMLDNNCMDTVDQYVDDRDFYAPKAAKIYKIIRELIEAGETANIISVTEKFGSASEISQLTNVPTAANVEFYCKRVRDLSLRRKVKAMAGELVNLPEDHSRDIQQIVESIESQLSTVMDRKSWNYKVVGDYIYPAVCAMEELRSTGGILGVSTGYPGLDMYTGGFIAGELTIIGARASIGKTALTMNFAEKIAKKAVPVGFVSLEMAAEQLTTRLLCGNSGVGMKQVRGGMMSMQDFGRLNAAGELIYQYPIHIYDYPNARLLDVKLKARNMHRREKIEVLFIDYLGLIRTDLDIPRWEEVGHITAELKALARELNIPVVVCAQVNRDAEGRAPTLANLRESGNIEQDADVVMFLHRKRDSTESSLIIAKNRNGGTGSVPLHFIPERTRFEEMEKSS